MVEDVRQALEASLRVRGMNLAVQIRKAGRRLPRRVRRDARFLADASVLAQNPKLARMVDMGQAARAHRNVLAYLETVDLSAARTTMALGIAASIAFALIVTAVLVVFVLVQRGFV
jgi:hypothetical protein